MGSITKAKQSNIYKLTIAFERQFGRNITSFHNVEADNFYPCHSVHLNKW